MEPWNVFHSNRGRLIHKWKHYFPVYERHFNRFRNQAVTVLEIGCGDGGSAQMWKRYFGPYARIIGIDIKPECKAFEEDQIHIRIGDQGDTVFLNSVMAEFGPVQILIDDGSHMMHDIQRSFAHLYYHPMLDTCGVYLVEDLHTAYWSNFGGGYLHENSFIEMSKRNVDELNAYHSRGAVMPSPFTEMTLSVHFYDSMVVYERGRRGPNQSLISNSTGVRRG